MSDPRIDQRALEVVAGVAEVIFRSDEHEHGAPARMGWARLLKRVLDLDLEHCPQCGAEFRIIAAIEEPAVMAKRANTHCIAMPSAKNAGTITASASIGSMWNEAPS